MDLKTKTFPWIFPKFWPQLVFQSIASKDWKSRTQENKKLNNVTSYWCFLNNRRRLTNKWINSDNRCIHESFKYHRALSTYTIFSLDYLAQLADIGKNSGRWISISRLLIKSFVLKTCCNCAIKNDFDEKPEQAV